MSNNNDTVLDDDDDDESTQPASSSLLKLAHSTFHQWTVKRYSLPDKTVASQVLMYRQLLHTGCKPHLKLSRPYEGTPAQVAVRHMPWWSKSVDPSDGGTILDMTKTGKMIISYDNLIARLWNTGVLRLPLNYSTVVDDDHHHHPPVPDARWIHELGFQQSDPVTDFRSGGILSLALMVWIVESCPRVFTRYCDGGDAAVLPFGITSINITDMLAKFLMLSKKTDRMDALLSQKPFWNMFGDPSAILAVQEIGLDLLADVVVELKEEKVVTVFDFAKILKITEHRVEYDLLGAGPVNVMDLRRIHKTLKAKYWNERQQQKTTTTEPTKKTNNKNFVSGLGAVVGGVAGKAGQATGSVLSQAGKAGQAGLAMSGSVFHQVLNNKKQPPPPQATIVALPDVTTTTNDDDETPQPDSLLDGDWVSDKFQIDDDDL